MLTRRACLAAIGVAPVAFGRNRIDRSRLSAITDEIAKSPEEAIAFARQYGLRWLELRAVPGSKGSYISMPLPELRTAARQMRDAGLRVSFLNTGMLKTGLPGTDPLTRNPETPEQRQRRVTRDQAAYDRRLQDLQQAIAAAGVLEVRDVRVFTFLRVADPAAVRSRVVDVIGELSRVAEKEGVRLLIENESSCNVATCAELASVLEVLPSKAVGVNWDPLNGVSKGEPAFPEGYSLLPKHRIGNVQVKGRSILPGPQKLDWAAIFAALERDGYKGKVGLETHIFGDRLIEHSHESMREMLRLTGAAS